MPVPARPHMWCSRVWGSAPCTHVRLAKSVLIGQGNRASPTLKAFKGSRKREVLKLKSTTKYRRFAADVTSGEWKKVTSSMTPG